MTAMTSTSNMRGGQAPTLLEVIGSSITSLGARRVKLGRRREISLPDDFPGVLVVITGSLVTRTLTPDGREAFVGDVQPGELIGEALALGADGEPLALDVEQKSELYCFDRSWFVNLLQTNAAFASAAFCEMSRRQSRLLQRLAEIATLPMQGRLAAELQRLAEPGAGGTLIVRLPTHCQIARRIATQREAVTKELSRLERLGAIRRIGSELRLVGPDWRRDA